MGSSSGKIFVQCSWSSTSCETRSGFRLRDMWNHGQRQWPAWLIRRRIMSEINSGIEMYECTNSSGNEAWRFVYHTLLLTREYRQRKGTKQFSRQMTCPSVVNQAFPLTTLKQAWWAPEGKVAFEVEMKLVHGLAPEYNLPETETNVELCI